MSGDGGISGFREQNVDSSGRLWESSALPPLVARDLVSSDAAPAVPPKITISVYLDDGQVFDYEVFSQSSAREDMAAIVTNGYSSTQASEPNVLTHYPPHRIKKVQVTSPQPVLTRHYDRPRGA